MSMSRFLDFFPKKIVLIFDLNINLEKKIELFFLLKNLVFSNFFIFKKNFLKA